MYVKLWYAKLLSCFVFLTGIISIFKFFKCAKKIKVNVANGGTHTIWCRVAGDKAFSADAAGYAYYMAGATRGYSQIQVGNTLEFQLSTSSNSVYMTIISESRGTICKNHEITENRKYIITNHNALVDGKKKKMWIDTNGRDHMVAYDSAYNNDADFLLEDNFSVSAGCW